MPLSRTLEDLIDSTAGPDSLAALATRRGIRFGTATGGTTRLADPAYMAFCAQTSNAWTTISGLYPSNVQATQGVFDFSIIDPLIGQKGYRPLLGVFMIYHGSVLPAWMSAAINSGTWQAIMDAHIAGVSARTSSLDAWCVINETIDPSGVGYRVTPWSTASGNGDHVTYAFQRARAYNPTAKLFLCDNDLEKDSSTTKRAAFLALVDTLMATTQGGRPVLDGVCLQGHISGTTFTGAAFKTLLKNLITDRGLEVRITEFDVLNDSYTDLAAFDKFAADCAYRLFSTALDSGVTWFTTWDIRTDWTWLAGVQPGFTQRGLPYLPSNRPLPMERAIRAALA